jgi:parallel beta-helix repeat protein
MLPCGGSGDLMKRAVGFCGFSILPLIVGLIVCMFVFTGGCFEGMSGSQKTTSQNITALFSINAPGTYTLTSDCKKSDAPGKCAINISASGVTLDGGGHTLLKGGYISVGEDGRGTIHDITIRNIWIEGDANGIRIRGVRGARISNVTIVETIKDGLIIENSEDVTVEDSVFLKNFDYIPDPAYANHNHGGIVLDGAKNTLISRCSFIDNTNGIVVDNATGTTISSNYFQSRIPFDITINHPSSGINIYNNYLKNVYIDSRATSLALNAKLQAGTNIIGGLKTGGNYWYRDDGGGYSQTCVDDNHSGICDNPYEISSPAVLDKALRTDMFPLCGPVAPGMPIKAVVTPQDIH